MRRILIIVAGLVVATSAALTLSASPVAAGNWALVEFDPIDPVTAGEERAVGFTLLQHGRTPVDATTWFPDGHVTIGLEVETPAGTTTVPARPEGAVGHYVADIRVPTVDAVSIEVVWPKGLALSAAALVLTVDPAGSAGGGDGLVADWWPYGVGAIAAGGAGLVVAERVRSRRQPPVARAA